jgi:hypothetical protein
MNPGPPGGAANSGPSSSKEAGREALALIHHHPGRLRVRADTLRNHEVGEAVRTALGTERGITLVSHNPNTGSVLVEYEVGSVEPDAVLEILAKAAGLDPPTHDAIPRGREPALVAIDVARELNDMFYELTGYRGDLRVVVPAGLAALAAYSFGVSKSDRLPRWDNLLYWSYNIFTQLHRREIDGSSRGRSGGAANGARHVVEEPPAPSLSGGPGALPEMDALNPKLPRK